MKAQVMTDVGQTYYIDVTNFTMSTSCMTRPEITIEGYIAGGERNLGKSTEVTVKKVIYNDPATIVYWSDNTRTVVKCQPGDMFDPKLGFLLAVCKKFFGNKGNYNELLKKHVPEYDKKGAKSNE